MCYIPEEPQLSYISVPSPSASPTPYDIIGRDFAFTSPVLYDTWSTSRGKTTGLCYYKRGRFWYKTCCPLRGETSWYCVSKVQLLMHHTRANAIWNLVDYGIGLEIIQFPFLCPLTSTKPSITLLPLRWCKRMRLYGQRKKVSYSSYKISESLSQIVYKTSPK